MKKRYFVWTEHHPLPATRPLWRELTGREYYAFLQSPEATGRYFADFGDVVLECSKEQYRQYRAERDHAYYLRKQEEGWKRVPLDCWLSRDGYSGEEALADPTMDTEDDALRLVLFYQLYARLQQLSPAERELVQALYLSTPPASLRKLSVGAGVSAMTLQRRMKKLLKKLARLLG